jgi:hypothetical protein
MTQLAAQPCGHLRMRAGVIEPSLTVNPRTEIDDLSERGWASRLWVGAMYVAGVSQ